MATITATVDLTFQVATVSQDPDAQVQLLVYNALKGAWRDNHFCEYHLWEGGVSVEEEEAEEGDTVLGVQGLDPQPAATMEYVRSAATSDDLP